MKKILAVDDNANTLEILKRNLDGQYQVITASNVSDAIEIMSEQQIELVITDNKMPQTSGLEFVTFLKEHYPEVGIIMITGYASVGGAVVAIKKGADEYLAKPFTADELLEVIGKTLVQIESRKKVLYGGDHNWSRFGIIGQSKSMREVFASIEKACDVDATVLITGENGTGKELVARAIHYGHNQRSTAPFIAVNCPGIPETLFESELFGHVKGAFTGAMMAKEGLFSAAGSGSIFLDEITEIPVGMQAKLLRVLQEEEIKKVGGTRLEKIKARVIAASNKDLEEMIVTRQFREDLFFRLNVINIKLPALRERREDIPLLAHYFLKKFSKKFSKTVPGISDNAVRLLENYQWNGNVREMENLIQRCVIFNEGGEITPSDFPERMRTNISESFNCSMTLKEAEVAYIKRVLEVTNGNKSKAAEILGIDRKTLREKIK